MIGTAKFYAGSPTKISCQQAARIVAELWPSAKEHRASWLKQARAARKAKPRIKGSKATLRVTLADGSFQDIKVSRTGSRWKVSGFGVAGAGPVKVGRG